MAQKTWPCAEVTEASEDVVLLAVHRNDDTDWTVRLNVIGYPQTLFLDAWGTVLPKGRSHVFVRTKQQVVAAIAAFANHSHGKQPKLRLPRRLVKAVPRAQRSDLVSPNYDVQAAAWRKVIPKLSLIELAELFGWERDAVIRLDVLRAKQLRGIPKHGKPDPVRFDLARRAVADENDYVRQEAFALLGDIGGKQAAAALADVITSVLAGNSGYANPNNMLCAAIRASGQVAEPVSVDGLARVLQQKQANNSATFLAVRALAAIGRKHGKQLVKPALRLALDVKGHGAARLHGEARQALGN